jgi:hypothetical protein
MDEKIQTQVPAPKPRFPVFWSVIFLLLGLSSGIIIGNTDFLPFLPRLNPAASPSPAPSSDPTANWIVYTGRLFEYKYPDFLYAVNQEKNDSIDIYQNKQTADQASNCIINNTGTPQPSCIYPLIEIGYSIANNVPKDFNFIEYTNQNGFSVIKNREAIGGMGRSTVLDAFFTHNTTIYRITVQTTPEGYWKILYPNDKISENEAISKEFNLLNQILSTFKFTGQEGNTDSGQSCTYKGKTYANGEGFKDSCNSCTCQDGQVGCTLMACQ